MLNSSPTAPRRETAAPLVIGVSSHRNIPAREEEAIRARVQNLFAMLRASYPTLPLVVLSSLAEGGDQWVADEALKSGIRLIAPLPVPRLQYEHDFADGNVRAAFNALCDRAEIIELACVDEAARTAGRSHAAGSERDRCRANAGMYLSAHCHILIAIWDGKDSGRLGGVAQIVNYHLHGIEPAAIARRRSSARHSPLGSDNERLLFHVVCSREGPDGLPASPLRPLQTYWRFDEVTVRRVDAVPDEFRAMFALMGEFNADWARYRAQVDAGQAATRAGEPATGSASPVDTLFAAADWLAIHFQHRMLFAMRAIYMTAALMGIAFVYYANFPAQDYMIFVLLTLFAFGLWISLLSGRRGWQRRYVDYRALAEGLRVQSYWRRAGLSVAGDVEFAHDNFLQKQDVELGWIRNVMRSADIVGDLGAQPAPADGLAQVIAEWVGESGKCGLLHYFERRAAQRTRMHRLTEALGKSSLWLGIGISVFLAAFFSSMGQDTKASLVAVMAVASIIAAVREAYAYRKADKELIRQYRYLRRIFSDARGALDRAHDATGKRGILRALGETTLAEHAEWTLMHRERPLRRARFPGKV